MRVNFAQLERDFYGRIEDPVLMLEKKHGEVIGPLGVYYNLQMDLKYNEPSVVTFQYPRMIDGSPAAFYDQIVKDRIIRIEPFGVFIVAGVDVSDDGVQARKEVTLYSREYELGGKKMLFVEGTYNFWNPADSDDTILGMAIDAAPNWHVGYVSPALIGRYRTFDQTDEFVLTCLSSMQDKYGCVVIYDSVARTINAYDSSETAQIVPVYLSHDNLVKDGAISELEENFATQLWVTGADGIDIRGVNPTGENYIYNLDYYISNGDIPVALATKWMTWQNTIFARQSYYTSLTVLLNTAVAQKTVESARLVDMENERKVLENTRSANLQAQMGYAQGSTAWNNCQTLIDNDKKKITDIESDITAQKAVIAGLEKDIEEHNSAIATVNNELKMSAYFNADEILLLDNYLRHGTFEDSSFAVFDIATAADTKFAESASVSLSLNGIQWNEVECDGGHVLAVISKGTLSVSGTNYALFANIVSGTIDHSNGKLVCSFHLNSGTVNGTVFSGGNFTCTANAKYSDTALLSVMTKHEDIKISADGSVSHTAYYYTGNASISGTAAALYFTSNVTEYQKFGVKQELYNYALACHEDMASPTYEFEIDSSNFIADPEFEYFKDNIQLGCACYLQLQSGTLLTPVLIEIHFNFEDKTDFKLVFSNQFRRADDLSKLSTTLKEVSSTARDVDLSKYTNIANSNTTTFVQNLLQNGYDIAMAQISAGRNNMVTIDEMGICIDTPDGRTKVYLNNGMIALVDKNSNTVSMAMGHFLNPATNADFVGIMADIIGGTLLAGKNLVIECPGTNGDVMQFKVDSSGVVINNGRWYMRTNKGAMALDANYGFMAGTKGLFTPTDTGHIVPVCVDKQGNLILDSDGFPKDTNVWIGIDGKAYFRGNVYATDGVFNGTVYAKSGEFKGTVQASQFLDKNGKSMLTEDYKFNAEHLDLRGVNIQNSNGDTVLSITENGIKFISTTPIIMYQYSSDGTSWHRTQGLNDIYRRESFDGGQTWGAGYQFIGKDGENGIDGSDGSDANVTWKNVLAALKKADGIEDTFITATEVGAPNIYGGNIYGCNIYAGTGSSTFAYMSGDAFSLKRAGSTNDRAILEATDTQVRLILGEGSSSNSSTRARMYIQKGVTNGENRAGVYYTTTSGDTTGFTFMDDGSIVAHATSVSGLHLTFS